MLILIQKKPTHRRYQPLPLNQLAFNKTCLSYWELSPLPLLHAKFAHKYEKELSDGEDENYKEYLQKTEAALGDVEREFKKSGKLPCRLLMKIMNVVREIDNDMRNFTFAMACGLDDKTITNLKFCMEHAAITQNFTVIITESIFNILLTSKLHISFTKEFLACYCVKRSRIIKVCEQVCKQQEAYLKKSKKQQNKTAHDTGTKVIQQLTQDIMLGTVYWKKQRRQDRMDHIRENLRYSSNFHYVAAVGSIEALKYYCDVTCQKLEKYEIDEHVYQCAKFIFQANAFSAEKIQFFFDKMSPEMWKRLLDDEFVNIFLTFLRSWRHRHLCMQLFLEVKDSLDIVTIECLLREIASIARDKYQYHEVILITKKLWNVVPHSLKTEHKIAYIIPELMPTGKDIDYSITDNFLQSLTHLLKDCTVEMQEEIISHIIFKLVSTSEETHIQACLKTAQELGLKTREGKEYLTNDRLKILLVHDVATSALTNYDKLSKYVANSTEDENELKETLIKDKHFIADFLVNIKDDLLSFLEWALREESNINAFKENLLSDEFIDDIYHRRLIQFTSLAEADKIFEMLNINKEKISDVKSRVKDNTEVLNLVLLNCLGSVSFERETFFAVFYITKTEETKLVPEFLYSPKAKEAVYDMILDVENFYSSFVWPQAGAQLMLQWHRFIRDMVKPYTDGNAYEAMLLEDREMVINTCYEKVKSHSKFKLRFDDSALRMNIDLRLRCFSLLLHNQDLHKKLQDYVKYAVGLSGPFMFHIAMDLAGPF